MFDIEAWLVQLGAGEYAAQFAAEKIDFQALPHLTEGDLKELGLPIGPRRKVLAAIAALSGVPRPAAEPASSVLLANTRLAIWRKLSAPAAAHSRASASWSLFCSPTSRARSS